MPDRSFLDKMKIVQKFFGTIYFIKKIHPMHRLGASATFLIRSASPKL
jgi:hypothetical protein